jgi:phosphomannomutase
MEQKPRLTVSGYRGIWGKSIDEQIAFDFALSFAKIIKEQGGKKILIGRDARKSGTLIFLAIKKAFEKEGLEVENAGIIPTPTVLLLVKKLGYDGGILITASHNPVEYNGLKFVMNTGLFAGPEVIEKINKNKEKLDEKFIPNPTKIENEDNEKLRKIHINEVLKNIDIELIKNKKYRVAIDTINSAGSIIVPEFLRELGCEVFVINGDQSGDFAHEPEPLVKNLGQLEEVIIKNKADIGFAVDPDADRLAIANEHGEILSEEYTLALTVKDVLPKDPSDIVVNMSTSRMCEDIAKDFGKKVFRSKVGELNVIKKMFETGSHISGEGNGAIIYPKINTARDSIVSIGLILELMAREEKTVSALIREIPKYVMKKEKFVYTGDLEILYKKLKEKFSDATSVNDLDGLRFDWADSWVHVRPSNTEPKTWIIGEATTEERVDELFTQVKSLL